MMKRYGVVCALAFLCICALSLSAYSAPLLDDVPSDHWAHDALANLASRGILEGYGKGTFKGDRAVTRYEMAKVVARLLAENDREHAGLSTQADMEDIKKLSEMLRNELQAQGSRVMDLEESLRRLQLRVNGR